MIKLFENNTTDYFICVTDSDDKVQLYAAHILSEYLTRISGAFFRICQDSAFINCKIVVRFDEKLPVTNDGFCIKSREKVIAISAVNGRGLVYGAYEFLSKYFGCRWIANDCVHVPSVNAFEIEMIDYTYSPVFEYRDIALYDYFCSNVALPNKLNGEFCGATALQGGKYQIEPFAHSVRLFVPVKEYFETNPEYFPLVNGERIRSYSQLCFSNPEIIGIVVNKIIKLKKEKPEVTIISVSQSDGYNWCECENCMRLNEKYETLGGAMFVFINEVARRVRESHKDIWIDTLAYLHTKKPPQNLTMEDNVLIRYCNIEASITKPLGESDYINLNNFDKSYHPKSHYEDLKQWCSIAKKVFVWNYPFNGAHINIPVPNLHIVANDIKKQSTIGVKGILLNMPYLSGHTSFAAVKGYVFSNMIFNPDFDVEQLIEEAVSYYYEDAAKYMLQAVKYMEERVSKIAFDMGVFCPPPEVFYNEEFCSTLMGIYNEALEHCKNESQKRKVLREMIGVENIGLIHKSPKDADFEIQAENFFDHALACGVTSFKEMLGDFATCKKEYKYKLVTKDWYGGDWMIQE